METRYEAVNNQWPETLPAITKHEAAKAAAALWRKFARPERVSSSILGVRRGVRFTASDITVRRVWVNANPQTKWRSMDKGWCRLVHDVAHRVHHYLYPNKRPHDPTHEGLEREMVGHVIACGWLGGSLRAAEKPKPTTSEVQAARAARIKARIADKKRKLARIERQLSKLRRTERYYDRVMA